MASSKWGSCSAALCSLEAVLGLGLSLPTGNISWPSILSAASGRSSCSSASGVSCWGQIPVQGGQRTSSAQQALLCACLMTKCSMFAASGLSP